MKKILLIVGIVSVIICILSLSFAILNRFGYYHILDGTADLFIGLHRKMIIFFLIGIAFALAGIVSFIIHFKM